MLSPIQEATLLIDELEAQAAALRAQIDTLKPMNEYQERVDAWMKRCFGEAIRMDRTERAFRFLEESLELAQAIGATKEEALALVDYVFSRKAGDPAQEVGGVAVCLSALCSAIDLNMVACAQNEITRCEENTERIRAKHDAKPWGIRSALPGYAHCPEKTNANAEEKG